MLTTEKKAAILNLIHRQVVPAIGCTEPIAVAYGVAEAAKLLGCKPEHIELRLSGNILKNAMGVGIPGTGIKTKEKALHFFLLEWRTFE